jgi:hypothetical protein
MFKLKKAKFLKQNDKKRKHTKHIFKEGYWSKQFIPSLTSSKILTVQIITIIFIESKRFEHDKSRSLSAESEFLTLWCWIIYF